jgi:hypothetical protein
MKFGQTSCVDGLHELSFSLYCSFLVAWVEESRPAAWSHSRHWLYFWHPHAVALEWTDLILFHLALFLIPAAAIFLCTRLISHFSFGRNMLGILGGIIAWAGFPLVCLYRPGHSFFFLDVASTIAAVYFLCWAYRAWPTSTALTFFLLLLYYAAWAFFGGGAELLRWRWPWAWGIWEYAWFVYPAFGLCYTLLWGVYWRKLREGHQLKRVAQSQELIGRTSHDNLAS